MTGGPLTSHTPRGRHYRPSLPAAALRSWGEAQQVGTKSSRRKFPTIAVQTSRPHPSSLTNFPRLDGHPNHGSIDINCPPRELSSPSSVSLCHQRSRGADIFCQCLSHPESTYVRDSNPVRPFSRARAIHHNASSLIFANRGARTFRFDKEDVTGLRTRY